MVQVDQLVPVDPLGILVLDGPIPHTFLVYCVIHLTANWISI